MKRATDEARKTKAMQLFWFFLELTQEVSKR